MNKKPRVSIKTYNKIMSLPDDKRIAVMACYEALGCDVEYLDEVDPSYHNFEFVGPAFLASINMHLSFLWSKSKNPSKWITLSEGAASASIQRNA